MINEPKLRLDEHGEYRFGFQVGYSGEDFKTVHGCDPDSLAVKRGYRDGRECRAGQNVGEITETNFKTPADYAREVGFNTMHVTDTMHPDYVKGFKHGTAKAESIRAGLTPEQLAVDEDGDWIEGSCEMIVGPSECGVLGDTPEFISGYQAGMESLCCCLDFNIDD